MDDLRPVYLVDNDSEKWGISIEGIQVKPPSILNETKYDFVIICVNDAIYDQIYDQLTMALSISAEKIKHWTYWLRKEFLEYYRGNYFFHIEEIKTIYDYVEKNDRLLPFNYSFSQEYQDKGECFLDDDSGLYFTYYYGKKLYLNRSFKTKQQAQKYIQGLMIEQDKDSPHKYVDSDFKFDGGCLLDAGTAEGNFALEVIERADKVIMIEADPSWNEALMKTFSPWKDKVRIVNKYLSDTDSSDSITINSLAKEEKIDFIKMDIEGAEPKAIMGGLEYFKDNSKVTMAICAYHNIDDEENIRGILHPLGYDIQTTKGYMVFTDNIFKAPRLVRGVLRIKKNER